MTKDAATDVVAHDKTTITLVGKVQRIVSSAHPGEPEKAHIVFEGADKQYREIRIENVLTSGGQPVHMKEGDHVEITVRRKS
jgi:hypothetical protein